MFTDHAQQQSASTQQGSAPEWTQKEVSGRLIVRFKSYKPAAAHKAELAVSVAGEGSAWTWIDRTNAATAYPTDFALIDVLDSEADKVKVRFTCTYCIQTTKAQAAWCCLPVCSALYCYRVAIACYILATPSCSKISLLSFYVLARSP